MEVKNSPSRQVMCLITRPIFAMTANYLLYNKATKSIVSLKGSQETSDDTPSLKEAIESSGGVDSYGSTPEIS